MLVVVGDTLYVYVTWAGAQHTTRVYTADAASENWPETLKLCGTAYNHEGGEDSGDIKYVDAYNCFISVATASRFSESCYIHVMTSYDGVFFRNEVSLKHQTKGSNIQTCIHNMGITGNALGHIDIFNTQQYVGYAYQPAGYSWANWKTTKVCGKRYWKNVRIFWSGFRKLRRKREWGGLLRIRGI